MLEFSGRPVLKNAGSISNEQMISIAHERYETFDANRRNAEAIAADAEDIQALEEVEKQAKNKAEKSYS